VSTQPGNPPPAQSLSFTQWLIVAIASIGFMFDIYELLMLPLVVRPALQELVGASPGTREFQNWVGVLFFVPALLGGLFGLVGGYLTDLFGRRRVLVGSILLYAFSAFAAGFSTNIWMLLVLRTTTFIGVCVEFVAAVAWLAELFPNPRQRETVLGYSQAFSSFGGLLVAIVNNWLVVNAASLPPIVVPQFLTGLIGTIGEGHSQEAWRYTLMSGLIPAIPLILIRPFLPESPAWQEKKKAGTLKRPSIGALFGGGLARTTIITTIMVAMSYGAAFGAIQQIPQIVPGLADVKEKVAELEVPQKRQIEQKVASEYTKVQEVGGLVGRFIFAVLAVAVLSRRALLWLFQVPGLIVVPLVFFYFLAVPNTHFFTIDLSAIRLGQFPITTVSLGVFLAGLFTVAQFSFWGNYLPLVYPMHLRGTGESFAANIGGRMIGTSFALVTTQIAALAFVPGGSAPQKIAYVAAGVALFVYLVGFISSFFLPEPKQESLTD
jgi:MFS family permease